MLHSTWMQEIVRRRAQAGIRIVSLTREGIRILEQALTRNEIVALHVDGDQFRRGINVNVAGRWIEFPTGPAKLAAKSGAALIFGYCTREGGAQRGRVIKEIALADGSQESVRRATFELAALFEETIRTHSTEWTIFRDFFVAGQAREQFSAREEFSGRQQSSTLEQTPAHEQFSTQGQSSPTLGSLERVPS
jgi:KDO2-lipid IV(A) lauroyltransferase